MSRSTKLTGFTRMLLFLVVFVPTVVFGVLFAQYGEEGLSLDKAIELFSGEEITTDPATKINKLHDEIKDLEEKIKQKEAQIKQLEQK